MLKKILSISGRPGLYNLISQGKNCIIVESLDGTAKRMPVFNNERVMSLGDIAIYTTGEEKPLTEVMENIRVKNGGKEVDVKAMEKAGSLREKFAEVLPDFDEERVRTSDIKKIFGWYDILVRNGFEKFVSEDAEETESNLDPDDENKKDKEASATEV